MVQVDLLSKKAMKNLFKASYYFALIAIGLLFGCIESENDISKANAIGKLGVQIPFDNHKINEVFDPCKWVWGNNFKSEKRKRFNFFKEQRKSICCTTAIKQPMIVDSVTICLDSLGGYNQWLIFHLGHKHQVIKLDIGEFYSLNFDSNLCDPNICFCNYNQDNFLDFRLANIGGSAGRMNEIWLFNPKKQMFEKSDILSSEYSLCYDSKKNVYQSGGRGGGGMFQKERFIIGNGKKKILKAIYVDLKLDVNQKYVTVRKFVIGRDTFIKTFSKPMDEDELYEVDPPFRDFIHFIRKKENWIKPH